MTEAIMIGMGIVTALSTGFAIHAKMADPTAKEVAGLAKQIEMLNTATSQRNAELREELRRSNEKIESLTTEMMGTKVTMAELKGMNKVLIDELMKARKGAA